MKKLFIKIIIITFMLSCLILSTVSAGVITEKPNNYTYKRDGQVYIKSHDYRTKMLYIFDYIDKNNITSPRVFFRDVFEIKDQTLTSYFNELEETNYGDAYANSYAIQGDIYSIDIIIAYIKN